MIIALYSLPVVLSLLVTAAHFLRAGQMFLAVLCLLLPLLLLLARPWSARVLQAALVLGALEWMYTLGGLVALRMELGQPVARMALILGGVAVFTAASALVFQSAPMARRHRIAGVSGGAG